MNSEWLVPDWPVAERVNAVCTTRAGGTSLAPFDSLNLGEHVGDSTVSVAANRALLQQAIDARPVFLSQVHGTHVAFLSGTVPAQTVADACVTDRPRLACTIMVADCLPVLLTDQAGSAVAAAHAGWRGLAGQGGKGVLESLVSSFRSLRARADKQPASQIIAWLGPCIGPSAFQVGGEVRQAFVAQDAAAGALFRRQAGDKWLADLQGLARLRLAALGVAQVHGNDGSDSWCTVGNPSRYFSYRRDRVCGRMAACIWLD
ncbi:MAG: peptidoglycan editing factor PgeF [Rhodoferax sp.]